MEARTKTSGYQVPQTFNSDENIVSLFEPDMLVSAQYFRKPSEQDSLRTGKEAHAGGFGGCD